MDASSASQLPGALRLASTAPFVGRERELTILRTLVPLGDGERRRIALIGGEAGSGKSRLVREFAREVAEEGVRVLYGACDAVVRTPYRPFAEALDQLVRTTAAAELLAAQGPIAGELARLLPDLPRLVPGLAPPVSADADTERHRLHSAVSDLLASVASRQPLLLVLEDGHWADAPTLLLLRHLARSAADARMLLLVTFRDTEADVPADLGDALVDLRRTDEAVRLHLGPLGDDDVSEFVRRSLGSEAAGAGAGLAPALCRLTSGNAFLLCELWRALVETESVATHDGTVTLARPLEEIATPTSVREVVSQRLSRLEPATRDLLELAAVAGPEFGIDVLRRANPLRSDGLAALEPAVRSGLIEESPSRALSYRFAHELVRRALYDRLSGLRRAELHLRVGEAIESSLTPTRPPLAELAYHFAAAAPIGGVERAVEYNLRAAEAATEALAFDEAAERLSTALELGIVGERARAQVLLRLGRARFRAGRSVDAIEAFRTVAGLARALDDDELLARAAIGFEDACWRPSIHDAGALELLEEAADVLEDDGGMSTLRVGLLAGLCRALDFQGQHVRAAIARGSAIEMARTLDDRRGLATVLMRAYWARGHTPLDQILEMLTEARDLGAEIGDAEIQAEAMEWRVAAFLARGDIAAARSELAAVQDMAEQTRQPFMIHVAEHYDSALALFDGRLAEAEAAAERSRELGRHLTGRDASGIFGIQMFTIRREQGRLAELAPVMRVLAGGDRGGAWRPGLAALLAELGMDDDVRAELAGIRRLGLDQQRESLWLAALTYLADASAAVGDVPTAELVYPELAPFEGTNVMVGHGVACYGAADRYLGMLAATVGDVPRAERHFAAALDLNRRMGAATWVAHTAYEHARMLIANGQREAAEPLLADACALSARIGMPTLLARARALGSSTPTKHVRPDGLSGRELDVLRLMARGLSNREIGGALFISEHTAANHVRAILRKTGSSNRTEAAAYAHRNGLVDT